MKSSITITHYMRV